MTMDVYAEFDRIRNLLDAEEYVGALAVLDVALTNAPQDADLLYLKVIALLGLKRYAEALPLSVRLLTPSSTEEGKWLALCSSLRALGLMELALQVNVHALKQITAPDFELARFGGDTLFRQHRYEEALHAYQPALTQFGRAAQSWAIWYNYAMCLTEEGNAKDAQEANRRGLSMLQHLLASGTVTSERYLVTLWRHEGILLGRLGRWQTAQQVLIRALREDQGNYEIALWLHAACKAQQKRVSAATILPWVFWTSLAKRRHDDKAELDLLVQRRSVPHTTLELIQNLIGT